MIQGFPETTLDCPHKGSGIIHRGFFSYDYEMRVYKCQQCGYRDEMGTIYTEITKKFPDRFPKLDDKKD